MWTIAAAFVALIATDSIRSEPLKIALTAWDGENHKHTIYFGFHPEGTYGFDSGFDEMPIPPVPTVPAFDIRFLDPLMRKQYAGDGAYVDIRPFVSSTQKDTFYVRGQPANRSFPLTFSWPKGLGQYFKAILLRYRKNGSMQTIDMTKHTMFVMTEEVSSSFEIITSGLKGKLPWMVP